TETISKNLVGTLQYMAPELLTGGLATISSDLYALGMTAYEMVTGGLPFSGGKPLAAAIARVRRPVPSPRTSKPGLDGGWERAILQALDPKAANRFKSAERFVAALDGDSGWTTIRLLAPLRFLTQTRRRALVSGTVIVLAAAGGVAWSAYLQATRRLSKE